MWTTYPERLQEAGVSWKVYVEIDDYEYGLNVLNEFRRYQQAPKDSISGLGWNIQITRNHRRDRIGIHNPAARADSHFTAHGGVIDQLDQARGPGVEVIGEQTVGAVGDHLAIRAHWR